MKKEFEEILLKKNIKLTPIRLLVYEILFTHQKAMSLYEIEQQFDSVERSTIFRTLKTFQENCLIHSIDDGTGAVKYALCDDDCTCDLDDLHIHFLCANCGETHCLKDIPVPEVELPENFSFESANFVVKGICPNCK